MQWVLFPDTCRNHIRYIGRLWNIFFDMFEEPSAIGFIIPLDVSWISLATLILIGLVITLIISPLQAMSLAWDLTPFVDPIWSNLPLLCHLQRLNIEVQSMLSFKFFGCKIFSLSWVFVFINQLSFGVTTKVHWRFVEIQYNDNKQSTSKSTCTSSEIWSMMASFICSNVPCLNRLLTSSRRHSLSKSFTFSEIFLGWNKLYHSSFLVMLASILRGCFVPTRFSLFPHFFYQPFLCSIVRIKGGVIGG